MSADDRPCFDRGDRLARSALLAVGTLVYAATATPGAYWLDSGELAAAGASLGIPHAPGHPLYVVLAHAASLVPLGATGFRVALLSGLLAGLALVLLYDVARLLVAAAAPSPGAAADAAPASPPRWPALLAAVTVGASGIVWMQAVRAEVYTLQLLLALWLLRLALDRALAAAPSDGRVPVAAAFVAGLGAGNHHLLLAVHLPAVGLLLLAHEGDRGALPRRLPAILAAGLAGAAVYVLLPIRAAGDPLLAYGDPRTLGRFWDVLTARVFRSSIAPPEQDPSASLAGALELLLDGAGPLLLALAPFGLALLLRRRPLVGAAVLLALVGNVGTKAAMILDPTNPDAGGYLQTGGAIVAALGAVALARAGDGPHPLRRHGAQGLGLLAAVAVLAVVPARLQRVNLHELRSPAAVDLWLTGRAAPNGVLLSSFYALHFNRLYHQAVAGQRPDLRTVHQGFEGRIAGGRALAARLGRRDPGLRPLLDAYVARGTFPTPTTLELAERRPIYAEPTLGLPIPASHLRYAGGLFRVRPDARQLPTTDASRQRRDQRRLRTLLGGELQRREPTNTLALLWLRLAVVRLHQGSADGAEAALAFVEELAADNRWTPALRPLVEELRRARRRGDPERVDRVLERIRRTDFRQLLGLTS